MSRPRLGHVRFDPMGTISRHVSYLDYKHGDGEEREQQGPPHANPGQPTPTSPGAGTGKNGPPREQQQQQRRQKKEAVLTNDSVSGPRPCIHASPWALLFPKRWKTRKLDVGNLETVTRGSSAEAAFNQTRPDQTRTDRLAGPPPPLPSPFPAMRCMRTESMRPWPSSKKQAGSPVCCFCLAWPGSVQFRPALVGEGWMDGRMDGSPISWSSFLEPVPGPASAPCRPPRRM
jgi:hypothetical protein